MWISRKERLDRRKVYFESKFKRCLTNCKQINSRQVFVVLYDRFENVLICTIYIGSVGPFRPTSNFPFFCQNKNSLERFNIIFENSSPKGFFWANKKKFEFSALSPDSRKLLTTALKGPLSTANLSDGRIVVSDVNNNRIQILELM